ncbi:MAG TPA: catalase family protein [Terriglobales bacterium]|nr:catalase family protein [Terriglobales bacterium]
MKLRHVIAAVLAALLVFIALAGFLLWRHDSSPAGASMGEYLEPDESYYTSQIIASAVGLSMSSRAAQMAHPADSAAADPGYKPSTYLRDVHAKSHGCVLAKFNVPALDPRFALGVFAQPHSYDAILRFSNGQPGIHADSERDARGLAIKLLDVPGKKLLSGEENDPAQDFILMNNPTFFIRTLPEYQAFSQALGAGSIYGYFLPSLWHPSGWHLRELYLAGQTQKSRPASLLTTRFWSASAYDLGPHQYVKYSARPCAANHPMPPADNNDPDYLRHELANQAAHGGACYDFMVQPQVAGKDMPVEDTTVNWSERDSPFVPVAKIDIPAQQSNTAAMDERCENLEFNPWHSLPAHRPVGVMNRIRETLYQSMSAFRREKNGAIPAQN